MPLLEKALDYVLGIVTENEEVKKFPKDFVTASMQWVRSWFLKDDPVTSAVLENSMLPEAVKKPVVEAKLNSLKDNADFMKQLAERLASYEQHRKRIRNAVTDSNIEATGDVHIGNTGNAANSDVDEENTIKGSTITAGGDFRLGNDNISGKQVTINNNYYGNKANGLEENKGAPSDLAREVTNFLLKGQTTEAIGCLLEGTEQSNKRIYEDALLLSARNARLATQERRGVVSSKDANTEQNRINAAIRSLLDEL